MTDPAETAEPTSTATPTSTDTSTSTSTRTAASTATPTDLSADQQRALALLTEALTNRQSQMVLAGPAGSGKTTIMRDFARVARESGYKVRFAAPTGKAAVRIRDVTGEPASTLHSILYRSVSETLDGRPMFRDPKPPCEDRTVLIIDEASMVSADLHQELISHMPETSSVLYVGDREQLPPVMGTWGPDFDHPTAVLEEIHRQALGNSILMVADMIRRGGKLPEADLGAYERRKESLSWVADRIAQGLTSNEDIVAISWTNDLRRKLNNLVRRNLGFRDQPLNERERLLVLLNNKATGNMNGEVVQVISFENLKLDPPTGCDGIARVDGSNGSSFFVHPQLIGTVGEVRDFKMACARWAERLPTRRWVHVDYGYGLTVHRAQGSEYETVIFVVDSMSRKIAQRDVSSARRLVYTALTRAKKRIIVVDL